MEKELEKSHHRKKPPPMLPTKRRDDGSSETRLTAGLINYSILQNQKKKTITDRQGLDWYLFTILYNLNLDF